MKQLYKHRKITEDYELTELVHDGKNSVYKALRKADGQPVVVKFTSSRGKMKIAGSISQEYEIAYKLDHPNIIKYLDCRQDAEGFMLVMLDEGFIDFEKFYSSSKELTKIENIEYFLQIAIQLTEAILYLHKKNIFFKDLHLSNIVIHPESRNIKLIDFGLASQFIEKKDPSLTEYLAGTLAYISPEQTGRMNREIDYRTDFYSLGVCFYYLLVGKMPFMAKDPLGWVHCHIAQLPTVPSKINPALPKVFDQILMKLLEKNPDHRYQSALGLLHDLKVIENQWEKHKSIQDFVIATQDISFLFQIAKYVIGAYKSK